MRIAHVVDSMEVGGAETLVTQLCRLQRKQGHDPRIYAIGALGVLGERMQTEGFVVKANVGHHLADSTRSFFRAFRESRPHVVHLHNPTPTIYAATAARMSGASSVISTRHSLVAPPHNRVMELKYAFAVRFCDWVVGICDATTANVKAMRTVPPRKVVRIYNGSDPLPRTPPENCPSKSGFTLVYVGRLEPIKNHPLLLNAFRNALASSADLRLWMVGDGSERSRLEKLTSELGISHQVTFWGQQMNVAPFFSAADAFIMSSHSEGLPMSLLQAFSLGVPAIVTAVGGMAEVVRLAKAGFSVPPGDGEAMSAAILRLSRNTEEREQFSRNAQTAFESQFSLKTMADAYMSLYGNTRRARRRVLS